MTQKTVVHKCFECDKVMSERNVTDEYFDKLIDRMDNNTRYICEDLEPVIGLNTITYFSGVCNECKSYYKKLNEEQEDSFSW